MNGMLRMDLTEKTVLERSTVAGARVSLIVIGGEEYQMEETISVKVLKSKHAGTFQAQQEGWCDLS